MHDVAITDSNIMHGAIEFYLKCRKAGIKPIIQRYILNSRNFITM
jgi:DNA polymerase III alpha subunit